MKIGIDIRLIGKRQTGSEAVFFNLTKNLARIDQTNSYKLFTDVSDEKTLESIRYDLGIDNKDNFEIISLGRSNKFSWNFWTLPRYLRTHPLDIYLTQYILPFFVPKNVSLITIIHDISFEFFPQFIKKIDLFFLKTLIPWSIRRADKVIAVSQFTRDEIIRRYETDPGKVFWIHNAVSAEFIQKASSVSFEEIKNVQKKYALPEKYVLYIGTLQPRKNLPVLIEAWGKLKETQKKGVGLVIAGGRGHNYDQQIDKTIAKNGLQEEVVFPGFIAEEDKTALLGGAEFFCFPSLYEGFGIPILEAFTCGVPVLASDIAPHREISGEVALFFNPSDSDDLSEKMTLVLKDENLRASLSQKGKEQIKHFSWQKTAQKMLDIFQQEV